MNDRMKMDDRLRIIEAIYEDDSGLEENLREERPDLVEELEAMRSIKSALDARPVRRPDASALDAVLKAADDRPPAVREPRRDRAPQARRGLYLRSAGVATAVLTVLLAVMTVWQMDVVERPTPERKATTQDGVAAERSTAAEMSEHADLPEGEETARESERSASGMSAPGHHEAVAEVMQAAPSAQNRLSTAGRASAASSSADARVAPQSSGLDVGLVAAAKRNDRLPQSLTEFERQMREMQQMQSGYAAQSSADFSDTPFLGRRADGTAAPGFQLTKASAQPAEEDLAWDHADDVMKMYQRIEMMGDGVARGWEPPAVPLEMMPPPRAGRSTGIQPAGDRRTP